MNPSPFTIRVYDAARRRRGTVGAPLEVRATVHHAEVSLATVAVGLGHPRAGDLLTPGARLEVDYRGAYLLGGPVVQAQPEGPSTAGTLTVTVEDDTRLLGQILGWPRPDAGLTSQTVEYDTRSGSAEAVLKALAAANITRIGLPVTVAPNLGRGEQVTVQARMHSLSDRLLPLITQAGLGVTVRPTGPEQQRTGWTLDVYGTRVHPRSLTEESRVVGAWKATTRGPTATRVVIGGGGEGVDRDFRLVVDTALEALWGVVVEVFVDARDARSELDALVRDETSTPAQRAAATVAYEAELLARGRTRLAEGAPATSVEVNLSETSIFRFGGQDGVRVGDRLPLTLAPGVEVADVLATVELVWTAAGGLQVSPTVGQATTTDARLARTIARLGAVVRDLTARS